MPIIDACIVVPDGECLAPRTAQVLADTIATVFDAQPQRVWVRLQALPASGYAENASADAPQPVFLKILHADLPAAPTRAAQALALAQAVGACLGRPSDLVHVEYAAAGRGRVAFGGRLLE